jgi:phosphopantetheinyl transferase
MRDHRFDGRIIVPAVEIMQRLAASLQSRFPGAPVGCMRAAAFDRFLQADDEGGVIDAWHELELREDGTALCRLETSSAVGGGSVRRTKVHAALEFAAACGGPGEIPLDIAAALEGIAFAVPAEKVYAELVPFGPSYRNIVGSVSLTREGASGLVRGPQSPAPAAPLGSPFPLDAAMHAACAWGQRFRGYVAFPVGFAQREVLRPTRPGEDYYCRVLPDVSTPASRNSFLTDILIYSLEGSLCEMLRGVIMKDVSGGRISPPAWVKAGATDEFLGNIRGGCLGFTVIDMESVAAFAAGALSPAEAERYETMGERRRRTYLAGRLALKRLARMISGDCSTPASDLHTVMPDGIRPRLPVPGEMNCSLSHDYRYAFAAADHEAVGVDVERVSERAMKARHIYMSKEERDLAEQSGLGSLAASVRVWSIKEGLSKAVGLPLAECWKETGVHQIGSGRSLLRYRGSEYIALHDQFEDHLFTLVKGSVGDK